MKNLAAVKSFWMFSDQKLIQNQTRDESKVFLAASPTLHHVTTEALVLSTQQEHFALLTLNHTMPMITTGPRALQPVTFALNTHFPAFTK